MNIDFNPINMNENTKIAHTLKGKYIINIDALKKYLRLKPDTNNNPYNLCIVRNDKYQRSIAVSTNNLEEILMMENKIEKLKKKISNYESEKSLNKFNTIMSYLYDLTSFITIGIFALVLNMGLSSSILFSFLMYLPTKFAMIKIFGTKQENLKKRQELIKLEKSLPNIENEVALLEKEFTELKNKSEFKKVPFNILRLEKDPITNKPIMEYTEGNKDKIIDDAIKIKDEDKSDRNNEEKETSKGMEEIVLKNGILKYNIDAISADIVICTDKVKSPVIKYDGDFESIGFDSTINIKQAFNARNTKFIIKNNGKGNSSIIQINGKIITNQNNDTKEETMHLIIPENSDCLDSLDIKLTNGTIKLQDLILQRLFIKSINADVNIKNSDISSSIIESVNGDINANLYDENYDLSLKSLNGDINKDYIINHDNNQNKKRKLYVKTINGDINIVSK